MAVIYPRFSQQARTYLPDGYWDIDGTIPGGNFIGGWMAGACGRPPHPTSPTHPSNGAGTFLQWTGPDNTPMFQMGGSHYTLEQLGIRNVTTDAGILVDKAEGIGSGKHGFYRVSFENCDTCIQAGLSAGTGNCDHLYGWFNVCENCNTFMRTLNDQGQGHVFDNVQWSLGGQGSTDARDSIIFDYQRSGILRAQNVDVKHGGLVLKLSADGTNINNYHIRNLNIDSQAANKFRLLESMTNNRSYVYISEMKLPVAVYQGLRNTGDLVRANGPLTVCLTDMGDLIEPGMIHTEEAGYDQQTRRPHVIFTRAVLSDTPSSIFDAGSRAYMTVRDCVNRYGEPLPNQEGVLISN